VSYLRGWKLAVGTVCRRETASEVHGLAKLLSAVGWSAPPPFTVPVKAPITHATPIFSQSRLHGPVVRLLYFCLSTDGWLARLLYNTLSPLELASNLSCFPSCLFISLAIL